MVSGDRIVRSKVMPGCFDQNGNAAELAKAMIDMHGEQLKTLPIRTDISGTGFEKTSESPTLYDLLEFASNNEESAIACIYSFRRELNLITE